jgi:predicted TIM-barrel fold metal-dependent hydrolase
VDKILARFPDLALCVPHLGFDEVSEYVALMAAHDNLWLDTAMVLTNYFPARSRPDLRAFPLDRVMYGSDFPNIPYAWDRELRWLADAGLSPSELAQVTWKNAAHFFNLDFDDHVG